MSKKKDDLKEYRTYQFLIKEGNDLNKYFLDLMYNANNLYNTTNFYIRQIWSGIKLNEDERHPLQQEVINILKETIPVINKHNTSKFERLIKEDLQNGKVFEEKKKRKLNIFYMPNEEKSFPSYELLDGVFKKSNNIDYKSLPSHINQGVMKNVYNNWDSFFSSIKDYKQNPSKYSGRPKPPRYKTKGVTHNVTFSNQVCKIIKDKRGKSFLRFPKTKLTFNLSKHLLEIMNYSKLVEVRVQKYYNDIKLEIVLQLDDKIIRPMINKDEISNIMAIDLGVNNLASCVSNNNMQPVIINGRPLKSINQYYNKTRGKLYSDLRINKQPNEGDFTSKRLELLDKKRKLQIKDYMHKASKNIVDLAIKNDIHKVIVGYNKDFQSNVNIGKKNTQNFVNIPFGIFLDMLEYKLKQYGIHLQKEEESYTSKSSFLDNDEIPTYNPKSNIKHEFSGKRISRGLYLTKENILINADINGACNILRKHSKNKIDISHKILSNVKKININKGSKRVISTLEMLINDKNSLLIA